MPPEAPRYAKTLIVPTDDDSTNSAIRISTLARERRWARGDDHTASPNPVGGVSGATLRDELVTCNPHFDEQPYVRQGVCRSQADATVAGRPGQRLQELRETLPVGRPPSALPGGVLRMRGYLILGTIFATATAVSLGWKWQLGIFRSGLWALAGSMLMAITLTTVDPLLHFTTVTGTLTMWGATVLACLAGLLVIFSRDPDRLVPSREDVIVSPADGRVVYVRPVQPGQLPVADKKGRACSLKELSGTTLNDGGAVAIGISMNLSDVHVNRAPIAGRVRLIEHVHGTFGSLRKPEMLISNERVTTVIEAEDLQIALVQIASRLVRRIVTFVAKGDVLRLGQRIGAIRLGSQVDLLIPAREDIRLAVQVGDRVLAGCTIVAITSRISDSAGEVRGESP